MKWVCEPSKSTSHSPFTCGNRSNHSDLEQLPKGSVRWDPLACRLMMFIGCVQAIVFISLPLLQLLQKEREKEQQRELERKGEKEKEVRMKRKLRR